MPFFLLNLVGGKRGFSFQKGVFAPPLPQILAIKRPQEGPWGAWGPDALLA